ncbi:hypothetical protein BO94DRAFT_584749 [Aspergillus sclerotioniger CBS 115572]|uniref:NACHT domain-containing protein n=1 Tax=Aspergillus sclerotioniger CBS 115572 TaxID=1450535 RepID=A0A317WW06_9EURO|nr:hypothetical protein BO94DRAFT_584749 [Aspergillus sclerotioniger CBS 115572]PWY89492.1 hypothetical protein BO94DRAFT_584749 [Aspergillus sclerotioniger CBS 115572]
MATSTLHCPSRPKDVNELIRRLTSTKRDEKEAKALQSLVRSMIDLFQNEKKSTCLTEAAQLAAIVDDVRYKVLISSFCNAILEYTSDNNILDPALLQRFAHALRRRGVLSADNASLGAALDSLHIRLDRAAKAAESEKQYQLICTLGLQASSYAYEALQGVPDNDGPWKAFCRVSWKVITVLAAVAGGISEMNPQNILEAAPNVMELLSMFKRLVRTGKEVFDGSESLKDAFLDTMRGLKKPMLWYGTLRYCRLLVEAGMFELLSKIIPELPAFKESFWTGLYAQLEQTWVASNKLKFEVEDFAEWLHDQECLKIAVAKYPQISEWKSLLASTFKKPCWEQSMPEKRRHHRAWEQCLEAKQYYADCRLIQYYIQGDHLKIRRLSGDGLDLDHCYINLSVLERSSEIGKHREGVELSLRTRLKVDTPTGGKATQLRDLFNSRKRLDGSSGRPRRILIRGRAGVGKTTLCKKIVYDFLHVKNKEHVKEIQGLVESYAVIGGLLQIPVQLDSLCFTWGEGLLGRGAKTMTALYQAIEIKLWRKDMVQLGKSDKMGLLTDSRARNYRLRSQIQAVMEDEVKLVELLAFNGLYNNVIEFHPRHRDALYQRFPKLNDSMLDGLSFLRSPELFTSKVNQIRYFVHLTFQEFFAATYFVRCWVTGEPLDLIEFESDDNMRKRLDPRGLIQVEKYNGRYNIMWRFIAGLLHSLRDEQRLLEFFHELERPPRDVFGPAHLRLLMHCFNEVSFQTVHYELAQMKSNMETELSRLFSNAFITNDGRPFMLATELEFPEYILEQSLKSGNDLCRIHIFRALEKRMRVSRHLLLIIASDMAGRDYPSDLRKEAISALARHHHSIPEVIIELLSYPDRSGSSDHEVLKNIGGHLIRSTLSKEIFQKLLFDERTYLRKVAATSLIQNKDFVNGSFDSAKILLQDEDPGVRREAVANLRYRNNLPQEVITTLISIAGNRSEVSYVRRSACYALEE